MSCKSNSVNGSFRQNSFHEKLHYTNSSEEKIKFAGDESKDRLYEPKRNKKMMRVLTVVVYVFSVSLAAIMLSLYYVFFWNPKGLQYLPRRVDIHVGNVTSSKCGNAPKDAQVTSSSLKTPLQFPADVFYDDGSLPLDDGDGNFKPTDFFDGNETSFEQPVLLPLNQQRENIFLQRIKDSVKR